MTLSPPLRRRLGVLVALALPLPTVLFVGAYHARAQFPQNPNGPRNPAFPGQGGGNPNPWQNPNQGPAFNPNQGPAFNPNQGRNPGQNPALNPGQNQNPWQNPALGPGQNPAFNPNQGNPLDRINTGMTWQCNACGTQTGNGLGAPPARCPNPNCPSNRNAGAGGPAQPQQPFGETVWKCLVCDTVVGRGPNRPNLDSCPNPNCPSHRNAGGGAPQPAQGAAPRSGETKTTSSDGDRTSDRQRMIIIGGSIGAFLVLGAVGAVIIMSTRGKPRRRRSRRDDWDDDDDEDDWPRRSRR
jgi:hypothetical protein